MTNPSLRWEVVMPLLAAAPVMVSPEQREVLEQLVRTHSTPAGPSGPHHVACGGRGRCTRECRGTRRVAKDGSPLAQAVADSGRWGVGARAAGRRAAARSAGVVHARHVRFTLRSRYRQ